MTNHIELSLELKSTELTNALCHAVEPDNRVTPIGLTVITQQAGNRLNSIITSKKSIKTLISTFNDLIETLEVVVSVLEGI